MKQLMKFSTGIKVLIFWILVSSCGFGPYYNGQRVQLFESSLGIPKNLFEFNYSFDLFNRNFYRNDLFQYYVPQENIDEWKNHIFGKYSDKEIYNVIYNMKADSVAMLKTNIETNNEFANILSKTENYIFLNYIVFSKRIEKVLSNYYYDYWSENLTTDYDVIKLKKYIKIGEISFKLQKNEWLKQRYAYQLIVLYRYSTQYQKVVDLYNSFFQNIDEKNASILKYWALSHVAFCNSNLGNEKQAQLDYLDVFYYSRTKKRSNYQSINKSILESLKDGFNDRQKFSYLVYQEIQNPGKSLKNLQKIAELDINHEMFKLLINREINKIEDWILSEKFRTITVGYSFVNENYKYDLIYTKEFITFVEKIAKKSQITDITYYNLVLCHLNFVVENTEKAIYYLNLSKNSIKTKDQQYQYMIENFCINILQSKKFDYNLANKLFNDLKILNLEYKDDMEFSKVYQSIIQTGYAIYTNRKQYDIAAIFLAYACDYENLFYQTWWYFSDPFLYLDKFASIEQIQNFMNIVENKKDNTLENFLLKNYNFNKYRYLDLLGTKELRNDNLEEALTYFDMIPSDFWSQNYSYKDYLSYNPFSNYLLPTIERPKLYDINYCNKSFFVKQLIEKKQKYETAKLEEKGKIALELANAYFNMSYFGKNWHYVCYGKSVYGGSLYYTDFDTDVNENYKKCNIAFKYYDEAIKLLKNKELKSQTYFLAASVYTNVKTFKFYSDVEGWFDYDYDNSEKKITNPYLITFKKFSKEKYEFYLEECAF